MKRILFSLAMVSAVALVGCQQNRDQLYSKHSPNSYQKNSAQNDQQRPEVFSVVDSQDNSDSSYGDSSNASDDTLPVVQPDNQSQSQTQYQPQAQSSNTYTIKRGDTLWSIARKELGNGHKWKDIVA